MKAIVSILIAMFFFSITTTNVSCEKEVIKTDTITVIDKDTVYLPAPVPEINVSMDTSSWDVIHYPSQTLVTFPEYGAGRYEVTAEGIKGYCPEARKIFGIVTAKTYALAGRSFYLKWKASGNGQFTTMNVFLSRNGVEVPEYYFTNTPARFDYYMTNLSSPTSFNSSTVIQENVWYYTKVSITETQYSSKTSTGNYEDQGGAVIETKSGPLLNVSTGTVGIYQLDPYSVNTAWLVVSELKIK